MSTSENQPKHDWQDWYDSPRSTDEDFTKASKSDLANDVKLSSHVIKKSKIADELANLHLTRIQRDLRTAKWFLIATAIVVSIAVAGTIIAGIGLAFAGEFKGNVAIAFSIGFTSQIIGITYIIARYHFPEGGGLTRMPSEKPAIDTELSSL